ncbi:MAG: alpha/beta hydrolase [Thermoguttaceae bacterium]|jgi:acetyl esterase/lipase
MKLTRTWTIGLAALLAWANPAASQEPPKRPPPKLPEGVRALRDLQYVEGGHERNRLDLYLPEKAEARLPLVVWIHGGAWWGGSKEGCPAVFLAANGYAVASINYRLSQHAVFPAQIEDCKAAIRWLRANAAKYHLDPDHVGVWGASAGGHLAAMLGATGNVKELEGSGGNLDQSSRVQCVVDWFGPSDMARMGRQADKPDTPVARLIGGPVQENLEKARKASPLSYVGKDSAPFLIMHGDKDDVVPLAQSEVLAEALKKAGVEVNLVIVKGNGHGGPGFNSPENRRLIEDFFAGHLGKTKKAETQPAKRPSVAVTISKETTYITGPWRKDGYVDYVAALNERCSKGITPENNAAVPFLKAMGPGEILPYHRDEYCRMLGIRPLPEKGDYYVTLDKYAKGSKDAEKPAAKAGEEGRDVLWEQQTQAMKRPWSKKEFPVLAGWLAANERPLALVIEASKRPRRYDPLISGDGSAMAILLPAVQGSREPARALTARAMLRLDEGKVDGAWEDLLACHRLARLVGQGPTLVDELVAITLDGMACAGDQALLQHARLAPARIATMRADLDKLPPMPQMVDKIDVAERFMFLDTVGMVARRGLSRLVDLLGSLSGDSEPGGKSMFKPLIDSTVTAAVDWDQVLRMGNSWYDRMVDACRKPTRAERQAALDKIHDDLRKLTAASNGWKSLGLSMLGGQRSAISERVGNVLVSLVVPADMMVAQAENRGAMQFDLIRLAFALAAYRADHGSYPAKLADLVPKYVAEVPKDIFIAAELHYRQEGGGYLLYSVGPNGQDDGGKGREDCKEGEGWDDIVVRVPAATPRKD